MARRGGDEPEAPRRAKERTLKIAYLGPEGSFSEIAIRSEPVFGAAELSPRSSIAEAVQAVAEGGADGAVVPIENAIAGSIEATERALAAFPRVEVERELKVAIHLDLLAIGGAEIETVRRVLSFPPATAQCRRFLESRLRLAVIEATGSTASAARRVAELQSNDAAAIASARAGEHYGLVTLAHSIEDEAENWTRFAVVRRSRA